MQGSTYDVLCSPIRNGEVELSRQGLDGKGRLKGVVYATVEDGAEIFSAASRGH